MIKDLGNKATSPAQEKEDQEIKVTLTELSDSMTSKGSIDDEDGTDRALV